MTVARGKRRIPPRSTNVHNLPQLQHPLSSMSTPKSIIRDPAKAALNSCGSPEKVVAFPTCGGFSSISEENQYEPTEERAN